MADVQLLSSDVDAAPKEYTLPAGQELVLKALYAEYDGSGAGAAWLPTVQIVSDSGHVAASIPMDASVAAAASVVATWGPFLRSAAAAASSAQVAPSVATFSRRQTDAPLSVAAGGAHGIPWLHAALPSDGSITGPFIGNLYVEFERPMITIEYLFTVWDDPTYVKAAVLGTDSRDVVADQYALGTSGMGSVGVNTFGQFFGDSTFFVRPNAHIANDLVSAYAEHDAAVAKTIIEAYLVIHAWPAPGYAGAIPGYPL